MGVYTLMANPEIIPQPDEPQPLSKKDLVAIAETIANDESRGKSADFLASFTSFLTAGLSHEKALQMLGIDLAEAQEKLARIREQQTESLKQNVATVRNIGNRAIELVSSLNPLRFFDKK